MITLKETRRQLSSWGKYQQQQRQGEGFSRENVLCRIGQGRANNRGKPPSRERADPYWIQAITEAVSAITHPGLRVTLVAHYIKGQPIEAMERHQQQWLSMAERELTAVLNRQLA